MTVQFAHRLLSSRRRLAGIGALVLALGVLLTLLMPAPAAHAATTCSADATTACIQGTIRTSDGKPASGVKLSIAGPAASTPDTTTDDSGRWVFEVTAAGSYTVTLDKTSLPDGQYVSGADTRTVQVSLHSDFSAIFSLSDSADGATTTDTGFDWQRFWQQFVQGVRLGLLLALASLGLSLIFGTTGLSNFAQGEMVSLGCVLAWFFMSILGNNLWLAGLAAVVVMALFGWAQDVVLWKPLRRKRLSLTQLMIVSIGLSIALQYVLQLWIGAGTVRIDLATPATVTIWGITLTIQSYVSMGIAIVAIAAVGLGLMYTRFGRATRAVSDNPALASASGIDVDRVIRGVWIMGSGLAGLAGVLLGLVLNGVNWQTGGQLLLLLFAAVTLGGLGTAFGAFAGAMVIGLIVELTNIWLPGDLKYATALALLIIILLFRPQGIFGRRERIG
ncbi:branched-chain amino acid ABC transporter permease [Microbacteriaceae bacterium K1510]|nr:branched-chain amino acid ABC transporter permease [Microbacteriaceae bacterium K1510]